MDKSQFSVLDGYSAKILDEKEDYFIIEFYDDKDSVVVADLLKNEFLNHPKKPEVGDYFGLIFYKLKNQTTVNLAAWPIMKYWHPSLQELK